jgi:predicted RNA-binding Zn ribbon-like protein
MSAALRTANLSRVIDQIGERLSRHDIGDALELLKHAERLANDPKRKRVPTIKLPASVAQMIAIISGAQLDLWQAHALLSVLAEGSDENETSGAHVKVSLVLSATASVLRRLYVQIDNASIAADASKLKGRNVEERCR